MTRNRALAVLQDLVAQREREVVNAALVWAGFEPQQRHGSRVEELLGMAVFALGDARLWLLKATEPAPAAPTRADRA